MAIKAGQIIHVGNSNGLVIDRIQTGGPGNLNIPTEKIYELGNYESVATIRDVPDLTFTLDSLDVSTEIEALYLGGRHPSEGAVMQGLCAPVAAVATVTDLDTVTIQSTGMPDLGWEDTLVGRSAIIYSGSKSVTGTVATTSPAATLVNTTVDFGAGVPNLVTTFGAGATVNVRFSSTTSTSNKLDLSNCSPLDVGSQWKPGKTSVNKFQSVKSVALPFLYVESMSYRFGLRDNATQSSSLRGDSIFYNPGPVVIEEYYATGATMTQALSKPSYRYTGDGTPRYALAVTVLPLSGIPKRLTLGSDYTESATGGGPAYTATVNVTKGIANGDTVRFIYATPATATAAPPFLYPQTVHETATLKPAAVRGKDIQVYVGAAGFNPTTAGYETTHAAYRWTDVQSVNIDWRITLEKDEEFGNYYAVGQDFDVPSVNGTINIKPRDPDELFRKISQAATGATTAATEILGPNSTVLLPIDIVIKNGNLQNASTGTSPVWKWLQIPDARLTMPGYSGRVQTKLTMDVPLESDGGVLRVWGF